MDATDAMDSLLELLPGNSGRRPGRKKIRDMQKAKLYRAEREAFTGYDPACVRFETMKELDDYINGKVLQSSWWRTYEIKGTGQHSQNRKRVAHPISRVTKMRISDGRGTRIARGGGSWMNMPKWARSKWVILHEIAHNIQFEDPGHGWQFAAIYLDMVGRFIGSEAKAKLKAAFKKHKVRFRPKSNRKGNPEALRKWREAQLLSASV